MENYVNALIPNLKQTVSTNFQDKAKHAAGEFESFFLSFMIDEMFQGIEPDPLFGGGAGEEVFRSFLNQEYAKNIVKSGGIGLSQAIMASLMELQEQQS